MTHSLSLMPQYFTLIQSGEKVLEGRLNDEKRKLISVDDEIVFLKNPDKLESVKAIVKGKYVFKSFEEMADKLDKSELGFKDMSKEEMIEVYQKIYSKEDEQKYGVAVFRIKLI